MNKLKTDKSHIKCHYCSKMGHYISECFKKKKDEGKNTQSGTTAVLEPYSYYPNELLMCDTSDITNVFDDVWILDSGCTMHVTPHRHYFDSFKAGNGGEVRLGDHSVLPIKGIGSVPFKMYDGKVRILQQVRWVPGLRRNLLSESLFDNSGYEINTSRGNRHILKSGNIVMKSVNVNGLYHVVGSPVQHAAFVSSEINSCMSLSDTTLWHNRLGHICNKGLHYLFKNGQLRLKPANLSMCENCIFGKQTRNSFAKSVFVAQKPLEYVHVDLWGPDQVDTIGGRKYFLSFIDHHSRKV